MRDTGLDVFMYLRKSRRDVEEELKASKEGHSYDTLERHRKQLLKLAKDEKHRITHIYEEIVSGEYIAERPQMQQMLKDIQDKPVDAVLVMDLDRLGRGDMADQGTIFRVLKYSETKIITPLETINPSEDSEELTYSIKSLIAREELKAINKRLRRGIKMSAAEGKFMGRKPPFGYNKNKDLKLIINEDEAWIVRKIFDWYVNQHVSTTAIGDRLNEMGIPSPAGKLWTRVSIGKILKREAYKGDIYYSKVKRTKIDGVPHSTKNTLENMVICENAHEPIVSREIFDQAQEKMRNNTVTRVNIDSKLVNPLAGLLKCEVCGVVMAFDAFGSGTKNGFYKCPSAHCRRTKTQKGVSGFHLQGAVIHALKELLNAFKTVEKNSRKRNTYDDSNINDLEKQIKSKQDELITIKEQLDNTHDLLEQKVYDINTFVSRQSTLNEQLKIIQTEIDNLNDILSKEKDRLKEKNKDYSSYNKQLSHVIEYYQLTDNTQIKNQLLKTVLNEIVYRRPKTSKHPSDFTITLYPKI